MRRGGPASALIRLPVLFLRRVPRRATRRKWPHRSAALGTRSPRPSRPLRASSRNSRRAAHCQHRLGSNLPARVLDHHKVVRSRGLGEPADGPGGGTLARFLPDRSRLMAAYREVRIDAGGKVFRLSRDVSPPSAPRVDRNDDKHRGICPHWKLRSPERMTFATPASTPPPPAIASADVRPNVHSGARPAIQSGSWRL